MIPRLPLGLLASLLLGLVAAPPAQASTAQIQFREGPAPLQVYPRDAGNRAVAPVCGDVTASGFDAAHLVVTRDGALWHYEGQPLQYSGGRAPFAFSAELRAGLWDYRFRVYLESGGTTMLIKDVDQVACGDVFLIQGQSNAVAGDAHGQGLANQSQRHWVRSFGTGALNGTVASQDRVWRMAEGEIGSREGSVGAWGLRMGQLIADRLRVPVAILNGGVGATPIQWHQRNDVNPEDTGTIYGRLLHRARNAGIDQNVRAILWYQGEANGTIDPLDYLFWFRNLRKDWLEDFPSVEGIYVFQVRKGCSSVQTGLQELMRQLADLYPEVTTVSTTAAPAHDGCHYWYAGYRELGDRIARILGRDLYGQPHHPGMDPPNLDFARFTSPAQDEIELVFRDPAQQLTVDLGSEVYFELDAPETVTGFSVSGHTIRLQLSGPTAATTVAWIGHERDGPWIASSLGVGALVFQAPIQP